MGPKSWSGKFKKLENIKEVSEIYLQGPYSHFKPNYKNNDYEYILNISNGIGVTPFFSILEDINELYLKKYLSELKKVLFIWIVPNELYIEPFIKRLEKINTNIVTIEIYFTKPGNSHNINDSYYSFFNIINKKPNISEYIENFVVENKVKKNKICILSCGSESLNNDIYKASSKCGIEVFNESFN
jgi:predicted ferric reductase